MCLKHCQEVVLGSCLFHTQGGPDELDVDEDGREAPPLDPTLPFIEQHGPPLPSNAGLHDLQAALEVALTQRGLPLSTSNACTFTSFHDILHGPSMLQASQAPTAAVPSSSLPQAPSTSQTQTLPVPPVVATLPPPLPVPVPSGPTSRQPRITQQLDELWMSDLAARAQHEAEAQKVAARRQEMEKQSRQRFCLHWFNQVRHPVHPPCLHTNAVFSPVHRTMSQHKVSGYQTVRTTHNIVYRMIPLSSPR